jgi:alpha-N-arabinofuranosidase
MLPVRWENEWPIILDSQTPVPWQVKRPNIAGTKAFTPPQSGNFSWRDDFDLARLNHEWTKLRTSEKQWVFLGADKGEIQLSALPLPLKEKAQPAYLARVQQHLEFAASTRMELPQTVGVSAGLVIFQSSDFHYFLGVTKKAGAYNIFLEEVREGTSSVLASADFPADDTHIELGLEQQDAKLRFYYSIAASETELIRNVDARLLSTQLAGGFVGATIGIHARSD